MYGAGVMTLSGRERIGTSEWVTIRSHARALYLPLDGDLVRAFGLKKGDLLKVKIEEVQRAVRDEGVAWEE